METQHVKIIFRNEGQAHRITKTKRTSEAATETNPATKARGRHPGFRLDASLM